MPHWSQPRPIASTQLMIRLAQELGVSLETSVEGTGLTRDEHIDPLTEIEGRQELAVLRNILRALDPSVPFGLQAGLRYHATTHGLWGFGLVSSPDVRSAIEFSLRYSDLSYSFNRIRFELNENLARGFYEDEDNPDDLRAVLVERDLAAALTLMRDGLGKLLPIRSLQLRSPPPAYARVFEPMFGVAPQFGAPVNCLAIDARYLDASGPMADEVGVRICEQQCRAMLELRSTRVGVAGDVRRRVLRTAGVFPSMNAVAAELGMSTRTLRNQLAREHTSYRKIIEDVRQALAEELLAAGITTVDAIAERLGYADASSFGTAFKRWTGVSPRNYRSHARH